MGFNLLLLLVLAGHVQALPTSFPKCPNPGFGPGFEKSIGLIHKATMIGGESRSNINEWKEITGSTVAAVKKKYAATGVMRCGTASSTVQLTGHNDLVTGAGHAFTQPDDEKGICVHFEPSDCSISFPLTGSKKIHKIKSGSMKNGGCTIKAVGPPDAFQIVEFPNLDWAVFELETPLENVEPYDVPLSNYRVPRGTTVLQVSSGGDNFKKPTRDRDGSSFYNFQNCTIVDRDKYDYISLQTDCDAGLGSSGAGQLALINDRLTLLAINTAQVVKKINGVRLDGSNGQPAADYDRDAHFNVSKPLEDDFLEEIRRRLGTRFSSGPQ